MEKITSNLRFNGNKSSIYQIKFSLAGKNPTLKIKFMHPKVINLKLLQKPKMKKYLMS